MERPQNTARHGVLRLPPGFRFHPTDEELVLQYLRRKVFSFPLPAAVIPEIDLAKHDPWDLPGGDEEEEENRYLFDLREATHVRKGGRSARPTSSGYWKASGKDRAIVASRSGRTVGVKRSFAFHLGKPPRASRTDWFMHEYSLSPEEIRAFFGMLRTKNTTHSSSVFEIKDWVVCRVFKKNRSAAKFYAEIARRNAESVAGSIAQQSGGRRPSSPLSSSSSSSCVTDLSDNGEENNSYEEENSS